MGCTYCGKEIGTLRLLRDNEFCTSKHRKLYRDRLNKVLGQALTPEVPPGNIADFITLLAPRECLPHAFPDLTTLGWIVGNPPPGEWHFPLTINPVAGKDPKRLTFNATDRPAAPRMADPETEIALPIPPSLAAAAPSPLPVAPTLPALLAIPYPAMAAQANGSVGLQVEPAKGKLIPAGAASPSFSAAAPRLPAWLTLQPYSPLALGPVIDSPAMLLFHAADRPAALRTGDREIASPMPASLRLTASSLPGIPSFAMAPQANGTFGLQAEAAIGGMLPAGAASPSFSAAALRMPASLTLDSNSRLALGPAIESRAKLLPLQASQAADRPAAPRLADEETAPLMPASLQLAASAPLSIPGPAMAAQANGTFGLEAQPATGKMLPAGVAPPSFSTAAPCLPAFLTLDSNSPLALGPVIDHLKAIPFHAADRPAAIRTGEQEIAAPIPALLQLTASALPGIPNFAMAAQANWSDGLRAEPAMGNQFPAGVEPSYSAASPRLPECLTLCWDSALVLGPVIDSRLQLLTFHAADRPAAFLAGIQEIAPPHSPSLRFTASVLPGIPNFAMAAGSNWSDGLRAEPAMGMMGPAGGDAPPSFSTAAPLLPACLTLEPVQAYQSQEPPPQEANFIPLEYYCAAATSGPSVKLEWTSRSTACALLPLRLKLAGEKLEGPTAAKKPETPYLVPAVAKAKKPKWEGRVIQMAAAAVLVVALTGFGIRFTAGIGTGTPEVAPDAVASVSTPAVKSAGPLESIRRAIATRAHVELNDTFEKGMEAWGHAKSWAPGWSHHAEGYVQPGQLALFEPSMKFTDYRMEFFGQIESKSIGWVVRAHDPKNYYAMKFTVIQSGLRPIIAMVHYPVTDGHAGRSIETPLMDVMVHNNTPYHVGVTVAGNRIITSIEGQEVDRWVEDQIPSGGVGFYSDAGERARLYWMKVSKNEDFLGKVCAYLSGTADASRAFAMLLPPTWNYDKR
jgi:hypothetical protein